MTTFKIDWNLRSKQNQNLEIKNNYINNNKKDEQIENKSINYKNTINSIDLTCREKLEDVKVLPTQTSTSSYLLKNKDINI